MSGEIIHFTRDLGLTQEKLSQAQAAMQEYSTRMSLRPVMLAVAAYLRYETQRNWDAEGDYTGKRWAPLTEKYLRWKQKHGYDSHILHRTLKMRNAFTLKYGDGHIETVTDRSLRFGVAPGSYAAKLARIHANGKNGRNPFDFRQPDVDRKAGEMIRQYILEGKIRAPEFL